MNGEIPTATLIFGDYFFSKNNLTSIKKKYPNFRWTVLSASGDLDQIRMEVGSSAWDDSSKFIIVQDLPNQKAVRDFLLNLVISCPNSNHIIIWDSDEAIKLDPNTKQPNKTWGDFINRFAELPKTKIINNGAEFTEKQGTDCFTFIRKRFEKRSKVINDSEIKLLISIVGHDRGLLESEIGKLCLLCPTPITSNFILEHAFPSSKEALIYKIGDALETGSYEKSIEMIERFLASGENENRIAETLLNKARWQMIVAYYWSAGLEWYEISEKLMQMGKFPSSIWHSSDLTPTQKKQSAEIYESEDKMLELVTKQMRIPARYIKTVRKKSTTKKTKQSKEDGLSGGTAKLKTVRGATLPHPFVAEKTVEFVRNKIANPNSLHIKDVELLKKEVLDRAIKVYLSVQEKLADIRYGLSPESNLQAMARDLTDLRIIPYE